MAMTAASLTSPSRTPGVQDISCLVTAGGGHVHLHRQHGLEALGTDIQFIQCFCEPEIPWCRVVTPLHAQVGARGTLALSSKVYIGLLSP